MAWSISGSTPSVKETTWLSQVLQSDPDHTRNARYVVEYEFSTPGTMVGGELTHENGSRVFRGYYDQRGPYVAQSVPDHGLIWNGQPLVWSTDTLIWDGD